MPACTCRCFPEKEGVVPRTPRYYLMQACAILLQQPASFSSENGGWGLQLEAEGSLAEVFDELLHIHAFADLRLLENDKGACGRRVGDVTTSNRYTNMMFSSTYFILQRALLDQQVWPRQEQGYGVLETGV